MSTYDKQVLQAKSILTDLPSHLDSVMREDLLFEKLEPPHSGIYHNMNREMTVIVGIKPPGTIVIYGESLDAAKMFIADLYRELNSDVSVMPLQPHQPTIEQLREAKVAALETELQAVYNLAAKTSKTSRRVKLENYVTAKEALNPLQIETDTLFN